MKKNSAKISLLAIALLIITWGAVRFSSDPYHAPIMKTLARDKQGRRILDSQFVDTSVYLHLNESRMKKLLGEPMALYGDGIVSSLIMPPRTGDHDDYFPCLNNCEERLLRLAIRNQKVREANFLPIKPLEPVTDADTDTSSPGILRCYDKRWAQYKQPSTGGVQ